jgi:integral membrane protein (TIGR01906 family)
MKTIFALLHWLVSLAVPVFLVLFVVGILLTPLYIQIEYRLPGFPEDPYGFTMEERLHWANISRKYLINNNGIEYLADQRLDENTPLYNQRELRHMHDVKVVVRSSSVVFAVTILALLGLAYWSRKTGRWGNFLGAISRGGWFTVGIIIVILGYLALNFNSLFTNFHKVFFEGDTWLFRYSDTLIRLFPIRFWRDAFIWIGVFALVAGFSLGYFISENNRS